MVLFEINSAYRTYLNRRPESFLSQVNQAMAQIAKETILVADSSKFGKRSLSRIAPLSDIDVIITDKNLPAETQAELRSREIKLVLV